ncbi:MAG: hypothetical protein Ta2E_05540 [Mycoplasmoidaceae bacterium]|nr:MAG: hypothetical protein Ta2E_05540 [Mycoplasmoidaceae bacterium]
MAFISNNKRQKLSNSVNKSYGFKKFFILTTILLSLVYIAMLIIPIFSTKSEIKIFGKVINLGKAMDNKFLQWFSFDKLQNLDEGFGLCFLIFTIVLLLFVLTSIIFVLQMKSPKKVAEQTTFLTKSAIGGKASSVDERIAPTKKSATKKTPTKKK